MSSPDPYDPYNFTEFSDADLIALDAGVTLTGDTAASAAPAPRPNGGPIHLAVALDEASDAVQSDSSYVKPGSPYALYRAWRQVLSVTDLASPQWCEVQFDYGLRQMRHLPVSKRPELFTSATGKEISVEKAVAASNEVILEKGRSVHKVLEKEIKPEEVRVDVTTDEERWALRLVNMISALASLQTLGKAREMPVFGFVENQPVVGIIDEIHYLPSDDTAPPSVDKDTTSAPSTPRRTKRRKSIAADEPSAEPAQAPLTRYFSPSPGKTSPATQESAAQAPTSYDLHLSDTKTRRSAGLPPDADTLSSRVQLMLYRRLLGILISDYDFSLLWAVLGLDASAPLSPAFAAQVAPLLGEQALSLSLDGLAALWAVRVRELGIARVHPTLTLVYRAQTARAKRKRAEPEPAQDPALEAAVAASLRDVGLDSSAAVVQGLVTVIAGLGGSGTPGAGSPKADTGPAKADPTPVQTGAGPVQTDASLAWALPPQRMEGVVPDARTDAGPSTEGALPPLGIIGTKTFVHDDTFLDAHVARTLAYWYGQRAPEGVPVELSRRCFTCEYCEGCEWREAKAAEAINKYDRDAKDKLHRQVRS